MLFPDSEYKKDFCSCVVKALQILCRKPQFRNKKTLHCKNRERVMLLDGTIKRISHLQAIKLHNEKALRYDQSCD